MRRFNKVIGISALVLGFIYFILRFFDNVVRLPITDNIQSVVFYIITLLAFLITLIVFFYEKNRKEALEPFIAFVILMAGCILETILKKG